MIALRGEPGHCSMAENSKQYVRADAHAKCKVQNVGIKDQSDRHGSGQKSSFTSGALRDDPIDRLRSFGCDGDWLGLGQFEAPALGSGRCALRWRPRPRRLAHGLITWFR
jgi:hypothetical protein